MAVNIARHTCAAAAAAWGGGETIPGCFGDLSVAFDSLGISDVVCAVTRTKFHTRSFFCCCFLMVQNERNISLLRVVRVNKCGDSRNYKIFK